MGIALRDLQIAHQAGKVQGGGGLADAAAHLVHGLALDIGGGRLVAAGLRPLSHRLIIGEGIAAVEDNAVNAPSRELHVADPPGGAGNMGSGLPQNVPEQDGFQLTGCDLRLLNGGRQGQRLAGGGSVHSALNGVQIKVRAYLFGNDSACGSVIGGVFHLAVKLIVDLLRGEGLTGEDLNGKLHHCLCFGTDMYSILDRTAQFVVRNRTALLGGGDVKRMILQAASRINRLNI